METSNENSNRSPDDEESTENNNQQHSQSQNNSGNIGREVDEEKPDLTDIEPLANETGFAENEENHSSRVYSQQITLPDEPNSADVASEKHPKRGPNHLNNPGGTAQENVDENTLPNNEQLGTDYDDTDNGYGI